MKKSLTFLALLLVVTLSSFAQVAPDGAISTPPVAPIPANWRWDSLLFNKIRPAGANPSVTAESNVIIALSYVTAGGTVLESQSIEISNGELASLLTAMGKPTTGDPTNEALRVPFRIRRWLVTNSKVKYGGS